MDAHDMPAEGAGRPNPFSPRRAVLIAAPILLVLFAGYWFGLRTSYEPILTGVEAEEAAAVVEVLEERKITHRLADGGRTILVPGGEADRARLELVGSELPIRGQVGFELFNQSDMGLTEFAQKINYQRALQGELARTILLLKGIRSVRVHLGLPERSLFRDQQSRPKASVTLILEPGTSLTESRVSGIQRMVAGAIPEMAPDAVAVLDGTGRVVSREAAAEAPPFSNSDAIIDGYRQRIGRAIERALPSLGFGVNVSLRRIAAPAVPAGGEEGEGPAPRGEPDYLVNIRITTAEPLDDSARLELVRAVRESTDFDSARGDAIAFLVGDVIATQPAPPSFPASDRVVTETADVPAERAAAVPPGLWQAALALALAAALGALAFQAIRRRGRDARGELAQFADQLRERLGALRESRA